MLLVFFLRQSIDALKFFFENELVLKKRLSLFLNDMKDFKMIILEQFAFKIYQFIHKLVIRKLAASLCLPVSTSLMGNTAGKMLKEKPTVIYFAFVCANTWAVQLALLWLLERS